MSEKEIILKLKINIEDFHTNEKDFLTLEEIAAINSRIEEKVASKVVSYCWVREFIQVYPENLPSASTIFDVKSVEVIQ